MAKDPVCGMTVVLNNAAATENYQGTTWYFCSTHCHEKFCLDPTQFLVKQAAPAAIPGKAAIYTCPMHTEVVQDHPGNCPKCGMALRR